MQIQLNIDNRSISLNFQPHENTPVGFQIRRQQISTQETTSERLNKRAPDLEPEYEELDGHASMLFTAELIPSTDVADEVTILSAGTIPNPGMLLGSC